MKTKLMRLMALVVTGMMASGAFAVEGLYCIVDLSGGTDASSYPVTYLSSVPSGGWTDTYKTTKLVLRYVTPGTFTMGSPPDEVGHSVIEPQHQVTLTKGYYIGVFEVTQRQWELVMGTRPSYFSNDTHYASRPVEQVSYNMIRGSSLGAQWPTSNAVDDNSFLGKIRAKTGLVFDLPTEAQWEYACRAGTTTALNSGKNLTSRDQDAEMDKVGRYLFNGGSGNSSSRGPSEGSAKVGSYAPNAWGLYDMHGNVWEWCLDWYQDDLGTLTATDPVGATSGNGRDRRGGSWYYYASVCRSAVRDYCSSPSYGDNFGGFRIVCSAVVSANLSFVIFTANGGVCSEEWRQVVPGSDVGSLPTPTRPLYQFKGWYTAVSGGEKVTASTVVTGDVTYYAKWKKDGKVAVSVVSENEKYGTVTGGNARYAPGEKVSLKATAKKKYRFLGWYDGTKRVSTKASYTYTVGNADVTLTARFAYDAISLDEPDDVECDVGEAIEVALVCASGTSVTYETSGLPDGVTFDKKTLVVSGKPTKAGASTVKIVATNKSGNTASVSFVINAGHLVKLALTAVTDDDAKGGSVSGGGYYEPGKKVSLKATAKKGYVFAGWSGLDEDRVKGGVDLRTAKISYVTAGYDEEICAYFVTASEDAASLAVSLKSLPRYDSSMEAWTGYEDFGGKLYVGVQTTQQIAAVSLSLPTVTVSGLPKGLKFNGDTYEIYGVPTKAGTYTVKVTVSNVSGASVTERFKVTVAELPIWASGSYLGAARLTTYRGDEYRVCDYRGAAAATVSKAGKLSGYFCFKGKRYSFAEKGYAERVENVWRYCPVCGQQVHKSNVCSSLCCSPEPVGWFGWYCPYCEESYEESELRIGTNVYFRVQPTVKVGSRVFAIPLRMEPGDDIASCGRLYFDDCDNHIELVKGVRENEYPSGGSVSLRQTLVGRLDLGTLPAKTLKKCFRGEEGGETLGEGDWLTVKTYSTGKTLTAGRIAGNAVSWSSEFVPSEICEEALYGGSLLYAAPVSRTGFAGRFMAYELCVDRQAKAVTPGDLWNVDWD